MLDFPALPTVPVEHTLSTAFHLRYEELSQDGRMILPAIFQSGMPALWAGMLNKLPLMRALHGQGILPIFSRMVAQGFPGPFGMAAPLTAKGGCQLAYAGRGDEVERLMLNIWLETSGPRGHVHEGPPSSPGEAVIAGRFFTEQVLTRPFAPPGQRKVLRLDVPGFPAIPETRHPFREHAAIAALPEGAVPLEPVLAPDGIPMVFGICHTDGNRHVNSLVYPRMFEEAAVRRFADLGARAGLARYFEVGFRKPSFAGERARILLQAFTLGERHGAVGVFVPEGSREAPDLARAHCAVRMLFEP